MLSIIFNPDVKYPLVLHISSSLPKSEKPNSGKKKKAWQPPFMEDQSHLSVGKEKE